MRLQTFQAQAAVPQDFFDPMTGTGLDPSVHQALEQALMTEGRARSQGSATEAAFEQAIEALGCTTQTCLDTYGFYRQARFTFEATVRALAVSLAAGDIQAEELSMMGGPNTPAAEQYRLLRFVVDAVLDAECGIRTQCISEFGGTAAILAQILVLLAMQPIEGIELRVPIWPPPPIAEADETVEVFPSDDRAEADTGEPSPPEPQRRPRLFEDFDITSILLPRFGGPGSSSPQDKAPVHEPAEEAPHPEPEPARPEPEPEAPAPTLPTILLDEDHPVVLFAGVKMMGAERKIGPRANARVWGERRAPQLTVLPRIWRAMEAGFQRAKRGMGVEPGARVASRTDRRRLARGRTTAWEQAETHAGFLTRETIRSQITLFTMEVYHLTRIRFERFTAAIEDAWSHGRGGKLGSLTERELWIASGPTGHRMSSTCAGQDVTTVHGSFLIASDSTCMTIAHIEQAQYKAFRRDMSPIIAGADSRSEIRARLTAHLMAHDPRSGQEALVPRFVHYRVLPPPPPELTRLNSAPSPVALRARDLFVPGTALRMLSASSPKLPRAARDAVALNQLMLSRPLTMNLDNIGALSRLESTAKLAEGDELLAEELATLKTTALTAAEMCAQGNPSACKQAASIGAEIAKLTVRIMSEADDPKAVLSRALALGGEDTPDEDDDEGLLARILGGFRSAFKVLTTPLAGFFDLDGDDDDDGLDFMARIQSLIERAAGGARDGLLIGVLLVGILLAGFIAILYWMAPQARAVASEVLNFQADAIRQIPRIAESVMPVRSAVAGLVEA